MGEQAVGEIVHYFQDIDVAIVRADAPIQVGDELRVDGAHDDFTFEVHSMEVDHEAVEEVAPGTEVGVKVPERAHEGSTVLRVG